MVLQTKGISVARRSAAVARQNFRRIASALPPSIAGSPNRMAESAPANTSCQRSPSDTTRMTLCPLSASASALWSRDLSYAVPATDAATRTTQCRNMPQPTGPAANGLHGVAGRVVLPATEPVPPAAGQWAVDVFANPWRSTVGTVDDTAVIEHARRRNQPDHAAREDVHLTQPEQADDFPRRRCRVTLLLNARHVAIERRATGGKPQRKGDAGQHDRPAPHDCQRFPQPSKRKTPRRHGLVDGGPAARHQPPDESHQPPAEQQEPAVLCHQQRFNTESCVAA